MPIRKLLHQELVRPSIEDLKMEARHPITLVADNVRSLYNVGSIFRTCDAARVEKLWLCGFTPHPPRKEIEKTALGSTNSVPWQYAWDITEVLEHLKAQGVAIAAVEQTNRSVSCFDVKAEQFPLAVIVGNEITGIAQKALPYCDFALEIPMFGIKHSLNVAVATGIILYECLRVLRTSTE